MMTKKYFFPIAATFTMPWSWQKYVFISALRVLRHDHVKNIYFFISVLLFRNHEKIYIFKKNFSLLLLRAHQSFYKIRACYSNFTVRNFSGVLHALLPKNHASRKVLSLKNSHLLRKMFHAKWKGVKNHFEK